MASTPEQTIAGAVSFEKVSDKLAALVFLLNTNNLTPEQIQAGAVAFQYLSIGQLQYAALYLLDQSESNLGPKQIEANAACFQCVPEWLSCSIFLLNSNNLTAEQIQAGVASYWSITNRWAAIVYLLNTNNLTPEQIMQASVCYYCINSKWAAWLYLLANYGGSGPPPITALDQIPGLLFQFLANMSYITTDVSGNILTWTSNLGSLPLVLTSNTGPGDFCEFAPASVNGHDAVEATGQASEMDSQQTANAFNFTGMTVVMVGTFDAVDVAGNGRFLSLCSQSMSLDDWNSNFTWQPAGTLDNATGGIGIQNGNLVDDTADDWSVPCIIISICDDVNGQLFIYFSTIDKTIQTVSEFPNDSLGLNSDTFSIFGNLMQNNCADGFMTICASWDRAITPTEVSQVQNFLSALYS